SEPCTEALRQTTRRNSHSAICNRLESGIPAIRAPESNMDSNHRYSLSERGQPRHVRPLYFRPRELHRKRIPRPVEDVTKADNPLAQTSMLNKIHRRSIPRPSSPPFCALIANQSSCFLAPDVVLVNFRYV